MATLFQVIMSKLICEDFEIIKSLVRDHEKTCVVDGVGVYDEERGTVTFEMRTASYHLYSDLMNKGYQFVTIASSIRKGIFSLVIFKYCL